ncbi:hypothetical protein BJY04DRAFT_52096 [Aspergillus karnatakaensis]|uniref:uncharacterized protein n=1 Tax=Aspergillus karnatakaensis TaxID=1810916 RepID=UPI003CCC91E3
MCDEYRRITSFPCLCLCCYKQIAFVFHLISFFFLYFLTSHPDSDSRLLDKTID